MGKNVLIVYAHHLKETSFNGAMLHVAKDTLIQNGHSVVVSDLYEMNFNPVISRNDVIGPVQDEIHFNYSEETAIAWKEGRIADDIKQEQEKVQNADLIIYQFPLHWMGLPAILKGWCDRIYMANYAFTETEVYDQGKFKGKKAMLSLTTGAPEHYYTTHGPNGDVNVLLWPLQNGILRLVGFDVLPPQICFSPQLLNDEERAQLLKDWEYRIESIFEDTPLYFIPISKFKAIDKEHPLKGLELTEDVINDEEEGSDTGLTVGHHLDRRLPSDSMLKPRSSLTPGPQTGACMSRLLNKRMSLF